MNTLPIKLYSTAQIQTLEHCAIDQYGISSYELMTQAGYAVFECLQNKWPDAKSIAVFCGAGNNAGDGYVVAYLSLSAGLDVTVYTLADPEKLKGDASTAYQKYLDVQGKILPFCVEPQVRADVIVDALFGTGLDRQVQGSYLAAIGTINQSSIPVISVDIPSGLNANTGKTMDVAVKAASTVTFIGVKQGLLTGDAPEFCGEIVYADLSVPEEVFQAVPSTVYRVTPMTFPRRQRTLHKGGNGHVLIIGGELGFSGAVMLAGEAALRVGAGLVTIATRKDHSGLMTVRRPELMCHGIDNPEQLAGLSEKANAVVIGPGLGISDWAKGLLQTVIKSRKLVVIDADALNMLAKTPEFIGHLLINPHRSILTPHVGEAARLLNVATTVVQQDRFAAVRAIQQKYGGIVLLKGAGTLIATDDDIAVSSSGNPGMASGGMGDALSGVIAGLIAQGFPLNDAVRQGVYIHGKAADLAAGQDGERGLIASDLMPYLRKLVNS